MESNRIQRWIGALIAVEGRFSDWVVDYIEATMLVMTAFIWGAGLGLLQAGTSSGAVIAVLITVFTLGYLHYIRNQDKQQFKQTGAFSILFLHALCLTVLAFPLFGIGHTH
jgi:hypothetical protein